MGVCSFCTRGKYSIEPLAGPIGAGPACMACPAGGDCSSGGSNVTFTIGDWIASPKEGIYRCGDAYSRAKNGKLAYENRTYTRYYEN